VEEGGPRWSRRSPWLRERAGRSICSLNGTDDEPGRPEAELAKNGDDGDDLSQPGLLRCWGGGPQEAAEDEGLPVLLGDQSVRTKGKHRGVRRRGTSRQKEEKGKGGGVGSAHVEGEKKGGYGGLTSCGGERVGGGGWRPARRAAGRGGGRSASAM
jgi:hypothetical protein